MLPASCPLLSKLGVLGRSEWIFSSDQCWHVTTIAGKGSGVVATRLIARGERILAEAPLATACKQLGRDDARLFARAVNSLLPADRAAFYELSQSEALYGARKTAEGVWRSNAYPTVDHPDGRTEGAVFVTACRINHACVPNAHAAWSKALARQTIHAVRQIAAGVEITVSYCEPWVGGGSAAHLRRKFGFGCACARCSLTGAKQQASDARLRRLGEVATLLAQRGDGHSPRAQLEALVVEKRGLLKAEYLPVEWAYMDMVMAFTSCCKEGDFAAARSWLRRAVKAARLLLGSDSKVVHDLEDILRQR